MKDKNAIFNEIKSLIEKESIHSRTDLKKFAGVYKRFCTLTEDDRNKLLPRMITNCSDLVSIDGFKVFLEENKITNRKQLEKFSEGAYLRFLKLSDSDKNKLLPLGHPDYTKLESFNDFDSFINFYNIQSRSDFDKRFNKGYKRFKEKLSLEEQNKLLPKIRNDYSKINSKGEIGEFIKSNKISSKFEFQHKYISVYNKYKNLSKEDQEELFPNKRPDYSSLETIKDFIDFIKINDISSKSEFDDRFFAAHRKFRNLLDTTNPTEQQLLELQKLLNENKSHGETYLSKLFKQNNFNFVTEKTFSDLKNTNKLRFDFYLPDYNLIIEYHGKQHFDETTKYSSESLIFNDKKKYFYCICNKINILYFTLDKKSYNTFGYFTEVITDPDILINKIKEIGMTNQS